MELRSYETIAESFVLEMEHLVAKYKSAQPNDLRQIVFGQMLGMQMAASYLPVGIKNPLYDQIREMIAAAEGDANDGSSL